MWKIGCRTVTQRFLVRGDRPNCAAATVGRHPHRTIIRPPRLTHTNFLCSSMHVNLAPCVVFSGTFSNRNYFNQPIGDWDTARVTSMSHSERPCEHVRALCDLPPRPTDVAVAAHDDGCIAADRPCVHGAAHTLGSAVHFLIAPSSVPPASDTQCFTTRPRSTSRCLGGTQPTSTSALAVLT